MKTAPSDHWLFDIETKPVFIPQINRDGKISHIPIPGKRALVAADTGDVLGIVGDGYRVLTNREAGEACVKFCQQAFKDTAAGEWTLQVGHGPNTRSWVHLDIHHNTHLRNLMGIAGTDEDPYTPFARITNSFNGSRAVKIHVGFLRHHCSNGLIFEQDAATVTVPHTRKGMLELKQARPFDGMKELGQRFLDSLATMRDVGMTAKDGETLVRIVTGWPTLPDEPDAKAESDQRELDVDLSGRLEGYLGQLGGNAYAVFNTMTDIAARPPASTRFRRDRGTLELRAGQWLHRITADAATPGFSLATHIAATAKDFSGNDRRGR